MKIAQTFSPMMVAGFSEDAGRRPAYIICFVIYIVSNLALALQNNYVALLLLRMVQAAGSSGFIVLSQGCVSRLTILRALANCSQHHWRLYSVRRAWRIRCIFNPCRPSESLSESNHWWSYRRICWMALVGAARSFAPL